MELLKHSGHCSGLARVACGLFLASCVLATPLVAGAGAPSEYQVKAAFLYNFAKFVTWPAAALEGSPSFDICVIADAEVQGTLVQVVKERQVDGRPVEVRKVDSPGASEGCHILFVTAVSGHAAEAVGQATSGSTTLVVGEKSDFARQGGMVNFVQVGNKVRFEINKRKAEAAGLAVSSRLLKLAHDVYE